MSIKTTVDKGHFHQLKWPYLNIFTSLKSRIIWCGSQSLNFVAHIVEYLSCMLPLCLPLRKEAHIVESYSVCPCPLREEKKASIIKSPRACLCLCAAVYTIACVCDKFVWSRLYHSDLIQARMVGPLMADSRSTGRENNKRKNDG